MKFCPNCGAELKPEAKFCVNCGTYVATATPPPTVPDPEPQPIIEQQESVYDQVPDPEPQPIIHQQEPAYEQAKEASSAFTDAITGKTNLVQRVINIITKPKEEWLVIEAEQPNAMRMIGGYALILALIPAVSVLIKYSIIGYSEKGYTIRSFGFGIQNGLVQLLTAVIGVYLMAWVIDQLGPSFDSEKNFGRSLQLAVYSLTPQWLAGILLLFSAKLSTLVLVIGLYAIYILAVGIPVLKKTPKEKVVGYVALTIISMIVIWLVLHLVLAAILGIIF